MSWKDTVISLDQWLDIIGCDKVYRRKMETTYENATKELEAQAEISFKAGYEQAIGECLGDKAYDQIRQEGIKEVVELVEKEGKITRPDGTISGDEETVIEIWIDDWEDFLKKLGYGHP